MLHKPDYMDYKQIAQKYVGFSELEKTFLTIFIPMYKTFLP
jgi:hypothetical protein